MDHELEELRYAAKYPFTKAAKAIITSKEVNIDYEVMERASRRVSNGIIYENIPILDTTDKNFLMRELLSYPIARMIASLIGGKYITRYVNAEVKRSSRYMQDNEGDRERVAKDLGMEISGNKMDVKSYLRYIPKTREYDIVNQDVTEGAVYLDPAGLMAVVSEGTRQSVQAGMPIRKEGMPKNLFSDLEEAAQKIRSQINESNISVERVGKVEMGGEMPPCMKRILDQLKSGENVHHVARWVIATYLMKRGFSIDEIIALFSNTPNFNDKTTRYQLEFIKNKGYGIPLCVNLDSYGICIEKCGIKSPVQYGKRRGPEEFRRRRNYSKE